MPFSKIIEDRSTNQFKESREKQKEIIRQVADEFLKKPTAFQPFIETVWLLPLPVIISAVVTLVAWMIINPTSFVEACSIPGQIPYEWIAIAGTFVATFIGSLFFVRVNSSSYVKSKATIEAFLVAIEAVTSKFYTTDDVVEPPVENPLPPAAVPQLPDTKDSLYIDKMITSLISREGGYVDHPLDKGGPTNYGITRETLAAWRGKAVSKEEVKSMTSSEAAEIYRTQYYFAPKIDSINKDIQHHVFDISVNCGPRTSIRLLQKALISLGEQDIKVDGIVGPRTREACDKYPASDINKELVKVRLHYYSEIVSKYPEQQVFIKGWTNRANMFA
jgi:hypothetical protein